MFLPVLDVLLQITSRDGVFIVVSDKKQEFDLDVLKEEDEETEEVAIAPLPRSKGRAGQAMSRISGIKKTVCHSNSFSVLPKYGVETQREEELGGVRICLIYLPRASFLEALLLTLIYFVTNNQSDHNHIVT